MTADESKDDKAPKPTEPAKAPDAKPTSSDETSDAWGKNIAPGSETTPSDVLKRAEEK